MKNIENQIILISYCPAHINEDVRSEVSPVESSLSELSKFVKIGAKNKVINKLTSIDQSAESLGNESRFDKQFITEPFVEKIYNLLTNRYTKKIIMSGSEEDSKIVHGEVSYEDFRTTSIFALYGGIVNHAFDSAHNMIKKAVEYSRTQKEQTGIYLYKHNIKYYLHEVDSKYQSMLPKELNLENTLSDLVSAQSLEEPCSSNPFKSSKRGITISNQGLNPRHAAKNYKEFNDAQRLAKPIHRGPSRSIKPTRINGHTYHTKEVIDPRTGKVAFKSSKDL